MIPKVSGQNIQFLVVQPLYESKGEKDKFIAERYLKVWMSKNDVSAFGEYIGSKGQVLKARTRIFNRTTNGYSNVAHSLKELEQVLQPSNIGFKTNKNEF